jgi:predicted kinase
MEKNIILLRGLPGSGKSTLAKLLVDKDYCHKEDDMFFVDSDGNYKFNPSKIKDAHSWCQDEVAFLMKYEHSPVVVSNTFSEEWEMEAYYKLAEKFGYIVTSIITENRHGNKSVHDVPQESINRMNNRFDIKL